MYWKNKEEEVLRVRLLDLSCGAYCFARGSYVAWQKQWKYEKDIFRDSKKNLLFLACNMATVQNLYTESENLFMYADDHQMYTTGECIENATQELKEETEKIT